MGEKKKKFVTVEFTRDQAARINDWRRGQEGIPAMGTAVRLLSLKAAEDAAGKGVVAK